MKLAQDTYLLIQLTFLSAVMNENLSGSIFIANNRTHNHPPDNDKKTVTLVRKAILLRCKTEDTPLKEIYDSEISKYVVYSACPFTKFLSVTWLFL